MKNTLLSPLWIFIICTVVLLSTLLLYWHTFKETSVGIIATEPQKTIIGTPGIKRSTYPPGAEPTA